MIGSDIQTMLPEILAKTSLKKALGEPLDFLRALFEEVTMSEEMRKLQEQVCTGCKSVGSCTMLDIAPKLDKKGQCIATGEFIKSVNSGAGVKVITPESPVSDLNWVK